MEMSEVILYFLAICGFMLAGGWLYRSFGESSDREAPPMRPQIADVAIGAALQCVWDWDMEAGRGRSRFSASPLLEEMLGLEPNALNGAPEKWIARIHPEDRAICLAAFENYAKYKNTTFRMEFRLRHASGDYLWLELRAGMVGDRCVGLACEITQRKRLEERLLRGAIYDPLTDLPNRALLLDRLERMLRNLKEGEGGGPSLALLHLSRFREINEALGHLAGDHFLSLVARRLSQDAPVGSSVARTGSNQFAFLAPSDFSAQMPDLVKALVSRVCAPLEVLGQEIVPSCALGWAGYRADQQGAGALMKDAEIALQQARQMVGQNSRDCVVEFGSGMRRLDSRHVSLASDLHHALERGEIEMHYQPIIRLADTKAAGFEALMRWRHPKYGMVAPMEFIPLAEESGLIDELGRFALTSATQELSRWQLTYRHNPPLFVSVNISRRELFREGLARDVKDSLAQAFLLPGMLKLEVTEGLIMRHPERAGQSLAQLRAAGAHIAIDDFGAGYSSLGWLQHLPFDVIKIDRALMGDGVSQYGAGSAAIVRAVVSMAHDMAVEVVAEGTDSSQKAVSLRETGCDYAQGFYYAHPMDREKVRAFLPRNRPR